MNPPKKLTSLQRAEEQLQTLGQQKQQQALEFGSVDEMLRHDALHTPVPPSIARRLQDSLAGESPPQPAWWRRLFGKSA